MAEDPKKTEGVYQNIAKIKKQLIESEKVITY